MVFDPSATDPSPLAVVSIPIATASDPLAVVRYPLARVLSLLAVLFSPNVVDFVPTVVLTFLFIDNAPEPVGLDADNFVSSLKLYCSEPSLI